MGNFVSSLYASPVKRDPNAPEVFNEWRPPPNPKRHKTLPLDIYYNWMTPVVYAGIDHSLEKEDLVQIPCTDDSTDLYERFEYYRNHGYSIIGAMMKMAWGEFLVGGFFMALNCALQMVAPQFLLLLIDNTEVQDTIALPISAHHEAWQGLWWCIGMFLCSFIGGMLNQLNGHITGHSGTRLRAAIVAACFRKGMTAEVSQLKKKERELEPGEVRKKKSIYDDMEEPSVINIIGADATQLSGCLPLIHQIWAAPVQIAIAAYFLNTLMGPQATACGIIVCSMCVPVSIYITKKTEVFRIEQLKLSDQRVQLTNEMFMGIKTVKYYNWEKVLYERLYELRLKELRYTRLFNFYSAASVCASLVIPMMSNVATVLVFCLYNKRIFWAKIAFTMSAYFAALKGPLLAMGGTVAAVVNTAVALRRVKAWLERPDKKMVPKIDELKKEGKIPASLANKNLALFMEKASFDWPLQTYLNDQEEFKAAQLKKMEAMGTAPPPRSRSMSSDGGAVRQHTLDNFDLHIEKGQFIAVVGNTGSGKTSLFLSMLGELPQVGGVVGRDGNCALVPQTAWILQDTMFNNIVFSNPYDEAWYNDVVDACQLKNDFLQLKNGDKTVLGDKGTGLSGGQKQRTSLARAVYAKRQIYLLDDVFSALDPSTGKKAFNAMMGKDGLLRKMNCTVVLSTGQPQYAEGADKMLVIGDLGNVVFFGTPEELKKCTIPEVQMLLKVLEEKAAEAAKAEAEAKALSIKEAVGAKKPEVPPPAEPKALETIASLSAVPDSNKIRGASGNLGEFVGNVVDRFVSNGFASMRSASFMGSPHYGDYETEVEAEKYVKELALQSDTRTRLNSVDVVARKASELPGKARVQTLSPIPEPAPAKIEAAAKPPKKLNKSDQKKADAAAKIVADDKAKEDNGGIGEEERTRGGINWNTIFVYIYSTGDKWFPYWLILTILCEKITDVYMSLWLVFWTGNEPWSIDNRLFYWLGTYVLIFGIHVACAIARNLAWAEFAVQAARGMYQKLLGRVLYAPQAFFDVTPLGRILNRFSFDTDMVDVQMIVRLAPFITGIFSVLASIAVTMWLLFPWALLLLGPSVLGFGLLFVYARTPMRDLQKLDNISKSPIQGHMQETLAGIASIRAFECYDRFCQKLDYLTDRNSDAVYCFNAINRWISVRVETIGDLISLGAALIIFVYRILPIQYGNIRGAYAGVVLLWAVSMTASVGAMISFGTQLEACMTSVERVVSYINLDREPGLEKKPEELIKPPPEWPSTGALEFKNVDMSYRPELPRALKNLSVKIKSGERVALVGRTGAGKSTISVALFRLAESISQSTGGGGIFLDGLEISKLPLWDVRGRAIAIITQDPVIFSGRIRDNMDPAHEFNDQQIWDALKAVKMHKVIKRSPEGDLTCKVDEGGTNFSVGQRQLLCLARALLRKPKVLVMDEATASLDRASDDFVQNTVRQAFGGCTILTVAHRLLTIADYDKVLVMEMGNGIEFGDPYVLLTNPPQDCLKPGAFRTLVDANGTTVAKEIFEIAERRYRAAEAAGTL